MYFIFYSSKYLFGSEGALPSNYNGTLVAHLVRYAGIYGKLVSA